MGRFILDVAASKMFCAYRHDGEERTSRMCQTSDDDFGSDMVTFVRSRANVARSPKSRAAGTGVSIRAL